MLTELLGVTERQITQLIRFGLFTLREEHSYWFCVPNLGHFLQNLQSGREEIVAALKRKKYKEMMLHNLHAIALKKSHFAMEFHVREMLGAGICECIKTSNGDMIVLKV